MTEFMEITIWAGRRLSPELFRVWMFIVGTQGTDEERAGRGALALTRLSREQRAIRRAHDKQPPSIHVDINIYPAGSEDGAPWVTEMHKHWRENAE